MDIQSTFPLCALAALDSRQHYIEGGHGRSFTHMAAGTAGYEACKYPVVHVRGEEFKSIPRTQALRDLERAYLADSRWVQHFAALSGRISQSQLDSIARSENVYRQLVVFPFVRIALQERDEARDPAPMDLPLESAASVQSPFLEYPLKSFLRFFWPGEKPILIKDGWAFEASAPMGPPADIAVTSTCARVSLLVGFYYRALEHHISTHLLPEWEARVRDILDRSSERFDAALEWSGLTRSVVTASAPRELWSGTRYARDFGLAWWPPHGLVATLRVNPCALTGPEGDIYYYSGGRIATPLAAMYLPPTSRPVIAIAGPAHPFIAKSGGALCLAGRNPGVPECKAKALLDHLTFAATTLSRGFHRRTAATLQPVTVLERISLVEARKRGVPVQPYNR